MGRQGVVQNKVTLCIVSFITVFTTNPIFADYSPNISSKKTKKAAVICEICE